jgi:hypothetical protein
MPKGQCRRRLQSPTSQRCALSSAFANDRCTFNGITGWPVHYDSRALCRGNPMVNLWRMLFINSNTICTISSNGPWYHGAAVHPITPHGHTPLLEFTRVEGGSDKLNVYARKHCYVHNNQPVNSTTKTVVLKIISRTCGLFTYIKVLSFFRHFGFQYYVQYLPFSPLRHIRTTGTGRHVNEVLWKNYASPSKCRKSTELGCKTLNACNFLNIAR